MNSYYSFQYFLILTFLGRLILATSLPSCNEQSVNGEIRIYTMPVGQGDGTIIKCPGESGEITILDMGKMKDTDFGIDAEKFIGFLEKISGENWPTRVNNIFLSHPDKDHFSFFTTVREKILQYSGNNNKAVNVFVGGRVSEYKDDKNDVKSPTIFEKFGHDNFFQAAGHSGHVSSWIDPPYPCGARMEIDGTIKNCYWIRSAKNGKEERIESSINICPSSTQSWSLTLMAANYDSFGNNNNFNSLVMKLTPSGARTPSMLFLGDFTGKPAWDLLVDASDHYQREGKEELRDGLVSDAAMIPHHGASTLGNGEKRIYDQIFRGKDENGNIRPPDENGVYPKPERAFAVISADIKKSWPKCVVIDNVVKRYPEGNVENKRLECKKPKDTTLYYLEYKIPENFDIYQTTSKPTTRYKQNYIMTTMTAQPNTITMTECNP